MYSQTLAQQHIDTVHSRYSNDTQARLNPIFADPIDGVNAKELPGLINELKKEIGYQKVTNLATYRM